MRMRIADQMLGVSLISRCQQSEKKRIPKIYAPSQVNIPSLTFGEARSEE